MQSPNHDETRISQKLEKAMEVLLGQNAPTESTVHISGNDLTLTFSFPAERFKEGSDALKRLWKRLSKNPPDAQLTQSGESSMETTLTGLRSIEITLNRIAKSGQRRI